MTLDEAYSLIEKLNDEAHGLAWDLWIEADEKDDEELRETASDVQRGHFGDLVEELDPVVQRELLHYCAQDEDFKEQFETYYGELD